MLRCSDFDLFFISPNKLWPTLLLVIISILLLMTKQADGPVQKFLRKILGLSSRFCPSWIELPHLQQQGFLSVLCAMNIMTLCHRDFLLSSAGLMMRYVGHVWSLLKMSQLWWPWVWFGLCCLMTPGLSKDIQGHVHHTFSKVANHQTRHQATHKVGCQPGDCIMVTLIFLRGLCGYVWANIPGHSLYHPRGVTLVLLCF